MSKPICVVTAPVATRSGYGAHSRDICRALISLDKYDVKIWPVRWGNTPMNALNKEDPNDMMIVDRLLSEPNLPTQPELHIHIVIPTEFQPFAKYNIGITAGIETTVCPAEWIQGLNKMNLNIVPSNFVKNSINSTSYDIQNEKSLSIQPRFEDWKIIKAQHLVSGKVTKKDKKKVSIEKITGWLQSIK